MFGFYLFSLCSHTFLLILGRFEDLWSYRLAWWPIRQQPGSLRRETYSETGRRFFFEHTSTALPTSRQPQRHVYPQRQPGKRGLWWGSPSAGVPFLPTWHGSRSLIEWQPCAQPRLLFPRCSAVSTCSLPSRLRELESWWIRAASQTGGAEQVRSVVFIVVLSF